MTPQEYELFYEKARRSAVKNFADFLLFKNTDYSMQWFHELIAKKCQEVLEGKCKRLMLFVPPQHGKSEITSRSFPAWVLGKFPKKKVVCASYSADLANSFCRDAQRIMGQTEYNECFGQVFGKTGYLRNSEVFETSQGGYYKTVGVGGALTGRAADLAIIDDPVKDALEANSETYRERVWEWYTNVLLTRLHNNSSIILIMTRWHEDDLAGKILAKEPDKWEVLRIPAIKNKEENGYDPREVGEPLWDARHNLERLREIEAISPRTFASLYQQNPVRDGGNIIKRDWFRYIGWEEFNVLRPSLTITFFIDSAYTEKQTNDPTGIIGVTKINNQIVVTCAAKVNKELPELLRWLPGWVKEHGYKRDSTIRIEPKASGLSIIQMLRSGTNLNVTRTPTPVDDKEARLNATAPTVEGGRVTLLEGDWNEAFITEVCGFPASPHDEFVDLLCYSVDYFEGGVTNIANLAKIFGG